MHKLFTFLALFFLLCSCEDQSKNLDELSAGLEDQILKSGQNLNYYLLPLPEQMDKIPAHPDNPITEAKVNLGRQLFFDKRLSIGGTGQSCASCHQLKFGTTAGVIQGVGMGGRGDDLERVTDGGLAISEIDIQAVKSPAAMLPFQPNLTWAGSLGAGGKNDQFKDKWAGGTNMEFNHLGLGGAEIQAIVGGLPVNHRLEIVAGFTKIYPEYAPLVARAFPGFKNGYFDNFAAGLAIASFERCILPNRAPFQKWLHKAAAKKRIMEENKIGPDSLKYYAGFVKDQFLTASQFEGGILFFGEAGCTNQACHSSPTFDSNNFHRLDFPNMWEKWPGVRLPKNFHKVAAGRGAVTGLTNDMGAFKVPHLYNTSQHNFWGHGATFESLEAVIKSHPQSKNLNEDQINKIADFLEALTDDQLERYHPKNQN